MVSHAHKLITLEAAGLSLQSSNSWNSIVVIFLFFIFLTALSFENESVRNENNRLSFNDGTRINAGQQFQGFNNLGVDNDLAAEEFNQGSALANDGLQFEVSKHVNWKSSLSKFCRITSTSKAYTVIKRTTNEKF